MPFQIILGDITTLKVDAIVNAANNSLLGGGGVDGAIHKAAGPKLLEECRTLKGCATGDAKITKGYKLPARYVIHTVGPIWEGGHKKEEELLRSAYRRSLEVAKEHKLETVAFSLISSGAYGYPKDQALEVAVSEITSFLEEHEMTVFLVIFDRASFHISKTMVKQINDYVKKKYLAAEEVPGDSIENASNRPTSIKEGHRYRNLEAERRGMREDDKTPHPREFIIEESRSLEDFLNDQEDTFSVHLLQLIDEKGKSDVEVYKRANIDRKLFSKIRSNPNYQPSKATVLALAISLKLSLRETRRLLRRAGYALSPASRSDLIIEFFLSNEIYDIHKINEALFYFKESLLGA